MHRDEQEIRQLISTWMSATQSGDIETVLQLMSDDVIFLRPGHPPMIGREAFATAAKGPSHQEPPKFEGRSEIQEIKILGDWAYMWTKLQVVVTPPGATSQFKRSGHTLSVLKKQNGKWVLCRDANMLAAENPPDSAG